MVTVVTYIAPPLQAMVTTTKAMVHTFKSKLVTDMEATLVMPVVMMMVQTVQVVTVIADMGMVTKKCLITRSEIFTLLCVHVKLQYEIILLLNTYNLTQVSCLSFLLNRLFQVTVQNGEFDASYFERLCT